MFEILHVDSWDHDRVYGALYEQVQTMAYHRLAIKLLSQRFDESVGRLYWSKAWFFLVHSSGIHFREQCSYP